MSFGNVPKDAGGIPLGVNYIPGVGFVVQQGTGQSNTDGSGNTSGPAAFGRLVTTIWTQASTAQTASGNSGDLTVGPYDEMSVDINITVVGGTTPTIQYFVDRKGSDGIYYPVWNSAAGINSAQAVSTSIGPGCLIAHSLGATIRVRWVIGGSSPSFTFSVSVQAK